MKHQIEKYNCDNCGNELPGHRNSLNIVTSLYEGSGSGWARLHIRIKLRSGIHNDANTTDADLCKACAVNLLKDALKRVQDGERATKGTESSTQGGWEE